MVIIPGELGLEGFLLTLHTSSLTLSQHVLVRYEKGKGKGERRRVEGKFIPWG